MVTFCGDSFVDYSLWNHASYPDTSPCFQNVVCFIFPSVLLMVMSTCRLYHLYHSKKKGFGHHWLATVQIVVCICLVIPVLADVFRTIHDIQRGHKSYAVDYVTAIFRVTAMALAGVIIHQEKKKGARYFGGLFLYWLLLALTGIFVIYSKVRMARIQGFIDDKFRLATFIIYYVLVLVQLVLSFVPNPYIAVNENSSPELRACFASRLTFWWFNGLILKGYRNPLKDTDLHDLNDVDKASAWVPQFEDVWTTETNKLLWSVGSANVTKVASQKSEDTNAAEEKASKAHEAGAEGESLVMHVQEVEGKRPSLVKCLTKVFLPSVLMCALLKLCHDVLLFVQPVLLRYVIQFVEDSSEPGWRGYMYGFIMFTASIAQSFFLHHYFYRATLIGMRLRSTVCASVYNKALKLSFSSREKTTVGEIVNLMSVDAQRFMNIMTYLNTTWSAPLQILVSLGMLWVTLGPSVLAGFAVMILMIPLSIFLGNKIKKLQVKQMKAKDQRIKLMSEILNGIKVLKLYAWEESFCNIIWKIRKKELDFLKKAGYINAFSNFAWQCTPFFVALISFAVYVMSDKKNVLDAEKAFVALSLFNIMRFPMSMIPNIVTSLIQAAVSVTRIEKFLNLQELDASQIGRISNEVDSISLKQCTFTWSKQEGDAPTLQDININVKHGELVAVVGVVGSGKSSLLSALLGDMCKLSGQVSVGGTVAYVAQQAWIQNAPLRTNILFGAEFDQKWYDEVVEACALLPDLAVLPNGDMTEIGEKGINLSGGQKQRVSLARAVYSKADIYYLDDPLSAVDAHVGKHIFDKVVGHSGLLKGKTRVLVTHGINFLPEVDNILVLKDGRLSESGSFRQLMDRKEAFADFLRTYFTQEKEKLAEAGEGIGGDSDLLKQMDEIIEGDDLYSLVRERIAAVPTGVSAGLDADTEVQSLKSAKSTLSINQIHPSTSLEIIGDLDVTKESENFGSSMLFDEGEKYDASVRQFSPAEGTKAEDKLIQAEKSQEGVVKVSVFRSYVYSMGWIPAVLVVVFFVIDQGCAMGSNVWLSKWSDDVASFNVTSTRNMYLGVYALFGILQGIFALAAMFSLAIGSWRASRGLHNDLLNNVVRCSMNFFDTTPTGRILNRFSKDTDVIDATLPTNSRSFIWHLLTVIGTLVIIAISTPWFLVVVFPLAIIYILIQVCYTPLSSLCRYALYWLALIHPPKYVDVLSQDHEIKIAFTTSFRD